MHHYITKYIEDGDKYAVSWFQINLFGRCYCLNQKRIKLA